MAVLSSDVKILFDKPLLFSQTPKSVFYDFLLDSSELRRRAEAGDTSAQFLYGHSVKEGWNGCVINKAEGDKWIILAAQRTDTPPGVLAQGICYEEAIGGVLIKNTMKAKECYSAAVQQGYIPAMCQLASVLLLEAITTTTSTAEGWVGGHWGATTATHTHKDEPKLSEVVRLITPCAEAGLPVSFDLLGKMYAYGHSVKQSYEEALKLFRLGAGRGGYVQSKRNIGICYENGWGVASSCLEARKWYEAAGEQGLDVSEDLSRACCNCFRANCVIM